MPDAPQPPGPLSTALLKGCVRLLVKGFYRRVEARGLEHLPAEGPVLFTPNHPNSLLDTLAVGSITGRRIHFVAKHTLFSGPLRPILAWAGVIPVRRRQDLGQGEGGGMRENLQAFEACFAVLDRGGAVGIFPEGITHDAPRLAPVKTGPARIALGAEERHGFGLGLKIVPVGLHFPDKAAFRSDVLVVFGEPIRAADWKDRQAADPRAAVRELTAEIERRLKALLPQIPEEDEALVRDVLEVYADRLPPPPGAEAPSPAGQDLENARQVAAAVAHFRARDPVLVAALGGEISRYRRLLARLGLSDRTLGRSLSPAALREEGLPRALLLVLGFPLALYGLLNNLLADRLASLSVRLFARKEDRTMVAMQRVLGGAVGLPLTYGLQGAAVWRLWGMPAALAYVATCPASGLFAWWYLRRLARAAVTLEEGAALLTHRWLLDRLRRRRAALRRELDRARERYLAEIAAPPPQLTPEPGAG